MKKFVSTTLVLLGLVLLTSGQCTLSGEVIGRKSKTLLIRKRSDSFRSFLNDPVKVFIKKGKFSYTFSFKEEEAYEIIFKDEFDKGSWKQIVFFPTNGKVDCRLYSTENWEKNVVQGGELNAEYESYREREEVLFGKGRSELMSVWDALSKRDEIDCEEYKEVLRQLRAVKSNDQDAKVPIYRKMDEMQKTHTRYTEKAKQMFIDPYDSLINAELRWKYQYIADHISPVSYFLIWSDVEMQMKDNPLVAKLVTEVFPRYKKAYPDHIYTNKIDVQVEGLRTISPGNKYIDFRAPSVEGDTTRLSDVIEGHMALIDLWGSWCGPCIAKSRAVVPIYNQYKDRGFKVVGIAREFGNADAVKRRLAKEQFSWLNLVELDDQQNIWNLYGINNGTGLMVLVDKDGTILAVDPTPDELESALIQKLN